MSRNQIARKNKNHFASFVFLKLFAFVFDNSIATRFVLACNRNMRLVASVAQPRTRVLIPTRRYVYPCARTELFIYENLRNILGSELVSRIQCILAPSAKRLSITYGRDCVVFQSTRWSVITRRSRSFEITAAKTSKEGWSRANVTQHDWSAYMLLSYAPLCLSSQKIDWNQQVNPANKNKKKKKKESLSDARSDHMRDFVGWLTSKTWLCSFCAVFVFLATVGFVPLCGRSTVTVDRDVVTRSIGNIHRASVCYFACCVHMTRTAEKQFQERRDVSVSQSRCCETLYSVRI